MSCSEYLSRKMQRTPVILDTRPHRDAGHQTELVKRLAASGNLESATAASACALVLNGPSTRNPSGYTFNGGHNVQDTSLYNEYTAGQAVAQSEMLKNAKPPQVTLPCYSSTAMPDFNDRLKNDASLAAVQASKNAYARGYSSAACCTVCGKPPVFASGCNCRLTVAQQTAFKDAKTVFHTIEPNVDTA
jgi:hypothetical protein